MRVLRYAMAVPGLMMRRCVERSARSHFSGEANKSTGDYHIERPVAVGSPLPPRRSRLTPPARAAVFQVPDHLPPLLGAAMDLLSEGCMKKSCKYEGIATIKSMHL
jgi:hypothetical protein